MAYYLDTSAAIKLIITEDHSEAMFAWIKGKDGQIISSDLLRTELLRIIRRGAPHLLQGARWLLDSLTLMTLPSKTFSHASELAPDQLKSLDAVHLAAAFQLGDELSGIVTYDSRLAEAARYHGIEAIAPE